MANKRRKVVDEDYEDYEDVMKKYNIEIPSHYTNQRKLILRIIDLINNKVQDEDERLCLEHILFTLPTTCDVCDIYKAVYDDFIFCEDCEKAVCGHCLVSIYCDNICKCPDCYRLSILETYQSFVENGLKYKLENLTTLLWLPVDIWKIVFHYTYKTNYL